MASQARNRSPERSFHGSPVSCTFVPGAWPTISSRAVVDTRNTGLGPRGRSEQARQARASAAIRSSVSANDSAPAKMRDHLLGERFR